MKSLKRVLWISDYFPRPHDMTAGVWALETIVAIQKKGVEVVVLSPTPWIPRWLALTPTLSEWSNVPHEFNLRGTPVFYPKCLHYPHRLITKYLYSFVPYFDSSLVWHSCNETISRLIDHYPFQVIHSNFIFPSGFIGLKIKNEYGIPLVVHERSMTRLVMAKNHMFRRSIYAQVIRGTDVVFTPNHKMANLIGEIAYPEREINVIRDAGNTERNEDTIPNMLAIKITPSAGDIENAAAFVEQKPERYKGKKIILSVGALIERKGFEYLIRAISYVKDEFPDIKCIIIGGGGRLRSLEKLINELSLNNIVELYGKRPHDEVLKTMSWCDVFVLPSWGEPFGTVYAEAMTFAKPIIACAGEGIGEILQDGIQGLLVKKQDVDSLAEALKKILNNETLAYSLGRAAKILADKKLNYNSIAAQMIDVYKQIIV